MKTLKTILQEVISGIKAWANDNFSLGTHVHGNITNDGKVGTTANLPLITGTGGAVQTGAFGNQANTFCEGNDSRLSDARTPVAHTHGKADITDLLNSNFIPSANNSYDLGSSSYQWNKIYSADVVHTSGDETITGVKTLIDYWHLQTKNLKAGEGETYGRTGYSFIFTDKNDVTMGDVTLFKNANAARTFIRIRGGDYYTNGAPAATGTLVQSALMVGTNVSGKKIIECDSDIVYPTTNNATDLGTSTNKWKSFNGINPGALSLPGAYQGINDQIKNPSDQLNAIDLNGGNNTWVSDVDCYLYFYIPNNKFTWIRIFWPATLVRCGQTFVPVPNESSDYSGFVPVPANTTVVIQIKGTQAPVFRRSACLGNV